MRRTMNDTGLALIKTFESLRLAAYQDSVGVWTIGYGHTLGVHADMTMTLAGANQALADDLHGMETAVDAAIGTTATSDNQFAAMVSLCFNIGTWNFRWSSRAELSPHR